MLTVLLVNAYHERLTVTGFFGEKLKLLDEAMNLFKVYFMRA